MLVLHPAHRSCFMHLYAPPLSGCVFVSHDWSFPLIALSWLVQMALGQTLEWSLNHSIPPASLHDITASGMKLYNSNVWKVTWLTRRNLLLLLDEQQSNSSFRRDQAPCAFLCVLVYSLHIENWNQLLPTLLLSKWRRTFHPLQAPVKALWFWWPLTQ